jgi:hypothetical protein
LFGSYRSYLLFVAAFIARLDYYFHQVYAPLTIPPYLSIILLTSYSSILLLLDPPYSQANRKPQINRFLLTVEPSLTSIKPTVSIYG